MNAVFWAGYAAGTLALLLASFGALRFAAVAAVLCFVAWAGVLVARGM